MYIYVYMCIHVYIYRSGCSSSRLPASKMSRMPPRFLSLPKLAALLIIRAAAPYPLASFIVESSLELGPLSICYSRRSLLVT